MLYVCVWPYQSAKVLATETYIFGTSFILDSYIINFYLQYILVDTSIVCQIAVVLIQEIMLIIVSISVYLSLFTITIILKLIQIDEQLLQVADCLPTLSVDTYYERGRRENFSCYTDRQREGEGQEGSDKDGGKVIEYESAEPGELLTFLFDTCDDKSKGIITVAGDGAPEYPSHVIVSIFCFVLL